MFDKLYLNPTRVVPYERTTYEYRAPTDESIKLYGEYQEKARKSIVDTLHIKSSLFDAKGVIFENMAKQSYSFWFKFKLNDEEYSHKIDIPYYDVEVKSSLIEEAAKRVSEVVTGHILNSIEDKHKL